MTPIPNSYDSHPASITPFSSLTPAPIPWLWPNRLPLAQISLLVSRPGHGKSLLATDIAARISTGSPCPKGSVIFIPREDDPAQIIRPRLLAHGADLTKIHLLTDLLDLPKSTTTPELFFNLERFGPLEEALSTLPDCKLVIFDPIAAYFANCDVRQDVIIRKSLNCLFHLAQRFGPAILLVHHLRNRNSGYADQRILGGHAFTSISRNIWHLLRDPHEKSRRYLVAGKSNFAPEAPGLAFTIDSTDSPIPDVSSPLSTHSSLARGTARITWEPHPIEINADEANALAPAPLAPGPIPLERQAAQSWLKSLLASGPLTAHAIRQEANSAGLIYKTVQRAADHLQIQRQRGQSPGQWFWKLPDG